MIRLVAISLIFPVVSAPALHAQTAEPLRATAGGLTVEVSNLRWAPLSQLSNGQNRSFGENYGLGYDFVLKNGDAAPPFESVEAWIEDLNGLKQGAGSGRKQRGAKIESYATGLNPHARARLVWEVLDPKAPDIADGRTEEILEFEVPLPPAGQSRALDLKRPTKRGAQLELREIKRNAEDVELIFEWQPPKEAEDLFVNLNIRKGQARDDKNTELGGKYGSTNGAYERKNGIVRQVVKLSGAPAADATTLDFKVAATQSALSQKQPQWFHRVSVPFDGALLPVEKPATVPAPLAALPAVATATATLESVEDLRGTVGARLWFESATPRGRWRVDNAQVTAPDGSEPFVHRSNELGWSYFFNRGGEMAPGKSGVQLNFSRPAGQTFTLRGEAQQFERNTRTFSFEKIPFPAKAGEMMAPKMVETNADGSKLILWKVGRFDTLHQPILGPYSPNPNKPIDWEGLVLVWEFRPAPGSKNVKANFDDVDFRDNTGAKFPGGAKGKGDSAGFGGHTGDVWRATKDKDTSGLTFKETSNTWYSLFKPLPSAGARSLATTMKIEEDAILVQLPFRFEAVPLPAAANE